MFQRKFADNKNSKSIASQLRQQRFRIFSEMINDLPGTVKILDVGGTQNYWEMMKVDSSLMKKVKVTLLNTQQEVTTLPNFFSLIGDARYMLQFENKQYDLVHSNSTIEHVGGVSDQKKMADEVMRVGKYYFIQTPNRYFPIEPHFVFPFFQFLPIQIRVWLVQKFSLGWYPKIKNPQKAMSEVNSISLLTRGELSRLFPGAKIYDEIFCGLKKSFIAYTPIE